MPSLNLNQVLGLNRRNLEYIPKCNPRSFFPLVDNKLETKRIMQMNQLPIVPLLGKIENWMELQAFEKTIGELDDWVMKPCHGFGGGGILVLNKDKDSKGYVTPSGKHWTESDVLQHAREILFGVFSIDNSLDAVILEKKVRSSVEFQPLSKYGLPDIRIITFHSDVVLAMVRIPTLESDGKANLHVGGLGAGVDLLTGKITHVIHHGESIQIHPDTKEHLIGLQIPSWIEIVANAIKVTKCFPLCYLGQDWVLNEKNEPMLLELNARPGLEIQSANQAGLRTILEACGERSI